jgi:predicted small metal-binding protein
MARLEVSTVINRPSDQVFALISKLQTGILVEEPARIYDEKGDQMAKVLECSDVGFDCGFEARADTEEELMKKVAEHAAEVHDMTEISEEVVAKVKAAIKEK